MNGSDPIYHFCYDDKWRIVGTWRGTDTDPKELFIYHNAGVAGYGGSSYIDSVVLRDRDMNGGGGWTGASDGTLEARHYYAQNWRADVSAIFDNSGAVVEWIKYSAYGVPYLLTLGDHNKDGVINKDDQDAFDADYAANHPRADLNKDGAWTTADQTLFYTSHGKAVVGGRWKLSAGDVCNRKGYAGYEHEGFGNDLAAPELAHVRHRVLHFGLGRWTRRDPAGYVDGGSLYAYSRSSPIRGVDPMGLADQAVPGGGGGGQPGHPDNRPYMPSGPRYPFVPEFELPPARQPSRDPKLWPLNDSCAASETRTGCLLCCINGIPAGAPERRSCISNCHYEFPTEPWMPPPNKPCKLDYELQPPLHRPVNPIDWCLIQVGENEKRCAQCNDGSGMPGQMPPNTTYGQCRRAALCQMAACTFYHDPRRIHIPNDGHPWHCHMFPYPL